MTDPRVLQLLLLLPPLIYATTCPLNCTCHDTPSPSVLGLIKSSMFQVNCSGLGVTTVPGPVPPETEQLSLSGNHLTDLFGQLPEQLPQLAVLDLSRNQIKQLGRGAVFHNLTNLRLLNLSHNDFRTVFNGVFRGVHRLRVLAMEHVQIRFIEEHAFDGLSQLTSLSLSHNQLSAIFPEWFVELLGLDELRLADNHIQYVNGGTFATLANLRHLSLNGNRIRGVSDHAFDGLDNLTSLYIEDNLLTRVPSASLQATKSIKVLRLGGNFFPQLHTGDFVRLLALEECFLENIADLVLVDRGAFWDLPHLRALHLHHNGRLRFLDSRALINVPQLRILSLHGCALQAVSRDLLLSDFQRHLQISLRDNPLSCDCNIRWIHEIIVGAPGQVEILGGDSLLCSTGVPVATLNASEIPESCPPALAGPANETVDRKIGDTHVFQCRAHGVPAPAVHWVLPGGTVINGTSNDIRVQVKGPGSLILHHIRTEDAGTYVCVAGNARGEARSSMRLRVGPVDIHLFPSGVASTFVTLVWNGTARNHFPEYEIVYRREDPIPKGKEYRSVTVSQFFRSYTVNMLSPGSLYRFCIGVKSDRQYVQFSCTRARTLDEGFLLQGVHRTSNVAVGLVVAIVACMAVVVACAAAVAARKYRQRHYDTPEKTLMGNMAQIPMENIHSPLMARVGS